MSKNISSHNQSGGITAHTVNIGGTSPTPPPEKPKSKLGKFAACAAAAVAFFASIAQLFDYWNIKPKPDNELKERFEPQKSNTIPMNQPQNINITSHNQSGGITAHTVNVGAQPRTLTPSDRQEVMRILKPFKKVTVVCVFGDSEAFQFANSIMSHLKSNGLDVEGVNQSVFTKPVFGQIIETNGENATIIIGSKQ